MRNMMTKKGKHKTVDKSLRPSVAWLGRQEGVKKIILGPPEAARHAFPPGSVKYLRDERGGVRLKAYGGVGVVDFVVLIDDDKKESFLKRLKERWDV
jgi:hypothetical protein